MNDSLRSPLTPSLTLLAGAAALIVAGAVIDYSGLKQSPNSWGYLVGSMIVCVLYGVPTLLLSIALAAFAYVTGPTTQRIFVAASGVIVAIAAVALAVCTVAGLDSARTPAAVAFAATASAIALGVLIWLGAWWRRTPRR